MIFVTVGSMLPFDRLIKAMDEWSQRHPAEDVYAQIGDGTYVPRYMEWTRVLTPGTFTSKINAAELVVAHAGMGIIISTGEIGKPIVLLPRLLREREHTTDHQLHTAAKFSGRPLIRVAKDTSQLSEQIAAARGDMRQAASQLPTVAPPLFIERIRQFIHNEQP